MIFLGCSTVSKAGSSPTPMLTLTPEFTPTPERLQLTNGELEACLLISAAQVEAVSSIQVTSEHGFEPTKDNVLVQGPTSCRYVLKNGEVLMAISATTDATLERQGDNLSAAERFQQTRMIDTDMAGRNPKLTILQEIDDLGDQAYSKSGPYFRIDINVLQNGIVYWFSTASVEDGGIGYDALLELARMALQRAP